MVTPMATTNAAGEISSNIVHVDDAGQRFDGGADARVDAKAAGQIDPGLDPIAASQVVLSLYFGLELQKALNPALEIDPYAAAAKALFRSARPIP